MSFRTLNATWAALHALPAALKALPVKRRPSVQACALVAVRLADIYHDRRVGVDETVDQLAEVLPMSTSSVRSCLAALDSIGWWVVERRGNQSRGSLRVPAGPIALGGADPAQRGDDETPSLRGADPTEHQEGAPRGTTPRSAGYDPSLRGADPATPHTPYPVVTSSCNGFTPRGTNPLEGDRDVSELRAQRIARILGDTTETTLVEIRHQLHEFGAMHGDETIADLAAARCWHLREAR